DLHMALRRQHGTAARVFLTRLAEELARGSGALVEHIETFRARIGSSLPMNADAQVRDVAHRFALVAAAGELAIVWVIVPSQRGDAPDAATTMLPAWIRRRPAGAGAAEVEAQLERVRGVLVQHGVSRFTVLYRDHGGSWREADPDRPIPNRIGWR